MLRSLLSVLSRVRGRVHGSDFGRAVVAGLVVWVWVVGCSPSDEGADSQDADADSQADTGTQDSNTDSPDADARIQDSGDASQDSGIDTHPRDGEPCIRGVDRTCCINEYRALSCESGSWGVLHDLPDGCPCSNATFCGGLAPLCPGAPDNYSLPPDAQ